MKYRPIDTDFASLQRELSGRSSEDYDEEPDPYAELAAQYENDGDDEDERSR